MQIFLAAPGCSECAVGHIDRCVIRVEVMPSADGDKNRDLERRQFSEFVVRSKVHGGPTIYRDLEVAQRWVIGGIFRR